MKDTSQHFEYARVFRFFGEARALFFGMGREGTETVPELKLTFQCVMVNLKGAVESTTTE